MQESAADRIMAFAQWCKENKLVKSVSTFERECGFSRNYLYNTLIHSNGNVRVDMVAKVAEKYPMLNVDWVVMGRGDMITESYYKMIPFFQDGIYKNMKNK